MFEGIQKSTFNDPDFKEDSVRELVIAPILAKLGYLPSGKYRIARSKPLKNPFVRMGTRNHPVTTIPDYTFYIDDKPVFVLDAKSPSEGVLAQDHIQQAYSYAIHPEIRCDEFGLCNGKELSIFNTSQFEPLLHINFEEFESRWNDIEKYMSPDRLSNPALREFAPDFGMALIRMGSTKENQIYMFGTRLNLFAKIDDSLMTASANCNFGSGDFCASFDFHPSMLPAIVSGLPDELANRFIGALNKSPFQAVAQLVIELDLTVNLGDITQVQFEKFVPLIIKEVHDSRFNPSEIPNDPNDIPSYMFKLRDHFVLEPNSKDA
jgi:Type I restriction enzyme R protein N terminus (HSDR_N)